MHLILIDTARLTRKFSAEFCAVSKRSREAIPSEDFRYKTDRFLGGGWKEKGRINKSAVKLKSSL